VKSGTATRDRFLLSDAALFEQFRHAMAEVGIMAPDVIEADGRLRRFPSNGKKSDDAGWYVLHQDGIPAGTFGDHRTGITQSWRADIGRSLTPAESTALKARLEAMRKTRKAEDARRRAEAARKAAALWKAAAPVGSDHPYLERKQVAPVDTLRELGADAVASILGYAPKSNGEALVGRILLAPIMVGPSMSSCELIDNEGRKSAIYGGTKAAGYWAAQALPEGAGEGVSLFIAEGVATALSVRAATLQFSVAALSSGNLIATANSIRKRYPAAKLVLAADLAKADGSPDQHAVDAALAVGAQMVAPDFGPDRPTDATDFNDMAVLLGLTKVAAHIKDVASTPENAHEARQRDELDLAEPTPPKSLRGGLSPDSATCKYSGGTFDVSSRGVFFIGIDKDGIQKPPLWICSPLYVVAKTRDGKSGEWGRLLEWLDDDRVRHQWAMPLELLQSDGTDMRRELARMGLTIAPSKAARDLLASFVQTWPVESRARCVERLGWHGNVFVTPAESIGQDAELVVFQNAHAVEPALAASGTLDQWRDSVAALAAGNSRLVFALSVAFAGALADVVGEDSGGFHLRGGSSSGKTTALKVAASVWGDPNNYPRLWRATANGLEGLAALHNDGLLILDELSQIDPKEAGEAAYLLANGQGKARASRAGTARQPARWRLLFLSAGEESLTALMARVGRKTNAGQEIRLADIDADAGAGMGSFETLHDQPSPAALALAIKDAANRFHGAVGLAWLRHIVADRPTLADDISDGIRQFVSSSAPANAAGQVLRVARRFALVAVAGELATHYGLTSWNKGESICAAEKCFAAWLDAFGGSGNREERAMLSQVRAFFETHGASRFEDMSATTDQRTVNRAGFYRTGSNNEREYLVLPEAFRRDVCQGFDVRVATLALVEAGWLQPGKDGKTAQKPRIPGIGPTRCYVFTARMWEGE
jgi:uncharacterized protein (DUF927 family)/phage/plasmid primase-like uncharacterized protein